MEAPSTINWATPGSTVLFAGRQLQWTTQSDLHMTAGHTVAAVAANAAGFFTHAGGIQAIAGNGPLSLQAHTDQLEILADKAITVISVNDVIDIKASQKITLQAGQSSITLEGGNITFACPGNFTVKGGKHAFSGGANKAAGLDKLPDTRLNIPIVPSELDVNHLYHDDETLQGASYIAKLADGSTRRGITDGNGNVHLSNVPPGTAQIQFKPDSRQYQMKAKEDNPDHKATLSESDIEGLLQKYRGQA